MRVPLSWLRDYAPIDLSVDELTTVLGELGTPVESVKEIGGGLDGVVVTAIDDPRRDDADRRLLRQHGADLHR